MMYFSIIMMCSMNLELLKFACTVLYLGGGYQSLGIFPEKLQVAVSQTSLNPQLMPSVPEVCALLISIWCC